MHSPLQPETIADLCFPSDPQPSPDGTLVAWANGPAGRRGEHAEKGIWVGPADGSAPARRWTFGGEDQSPRWSPDAGRLAFLSDRAERGTSGLYILPAGGGEARPLAVRKRSIAAFAWCPDGRRLAFLAPDEPTDEDTRREEEHDDADVFGARWQHHRLWLVDADADTDADGAEPTLAWQPALHLAEIAWSPDGSRLAVLARRSPLLEHTASTTVYVVTPGDEEPTRITEAPNASTLGWADDETLLWAGWQEREPQSSGTVWACPAHTDGVPRVVGTTPDEPRCTIGLAYSASGGRALLVVADGLDNRLEWLDPATGGREVAATLAGEVDVGAVVHAIGGPVVALVHYGTELEPQVQAGDPSALTTLESVPTTWSAAGAESERGPDAAAEHDSVELGTVSALACHASDGTALDAVVIRPHGDAQEPVPTVVLVHGGPYGRSSVWAHAHALDWGQLLATRGYAVVMPNYRGSYGRGNAFATAARGDMGGIEWGDVLAVVDAAIDAGIADPDRLGIGGWSQGGFLTAWAVTATDRFKAAVMGAGVSDWGMMAATSDLPAFEAALGGSRPWDGPGPHRAATGSPISFARRRTTPLLILHGAEDQRVPVTQAIAFRRAMADQDSPLELVTYPREPHGIRERRHQIDVQERVVAWYDRFLR